MKPSNDNAPICGPTVTVVMPAFNARRTIEGSIRSVLEQSVIDLELIVVDDGSSDGTPDLVRELAAEDRRIRLVQQSNAGPSAARNRGAQLARGEVVAFLDADDQWTDDHIALHLEALASTPDLGISFSACDFIDHTGALTSERTRNWTGDVTAADLLGSNPTATCSSLVIRKAVFDDAGFMREDMKYAEDQEWLFRVACTGWRIHCIAERTVRYRTSLDGLSSDAPRMLAGWQTFVDAARRIAPDVVRAHLASATSRIQMYHARRAIRTGKPAATARSHFLKALQASPRTAILNMRDSIAVGLACTAPSLANRLIAAKRGASYA